MPDTDSSNNKSTGSNPRDTGSNPRSTGSMSAAPKSNAASLRKWYRPLLLVHRVPVFKRVWIYITLMAVYSLSVDRITDIFNFPPLKDFEGVSAVGIILGLLLVFRTNSAYERWWEGRKLWGQLVNDSRNLAMKVRAIETINQNDKVHVAQLLISFAYALKHHLRGTQPNDPLPGLGRISEADSAHLPIYISSSLFQRVMQWQRTGTIDGIVLWQLDIHIRALMDICGGCERIKNSPIAISYRAFMRQGIALNLLAMPWYMAPEFPLLWYLPVVLISSYFLIGIELIAEDIEDPFGYDGDDLPLDTICLNIQNTIKQILPIEQDLRFTSSMTLPNFDQLKDLL